MKERCPWLKLSNDQYVKYHDREWGRPVHDDQVLFEFLILEGAQAGLSWETVLKKRDNYRKAFHQFDIKKVSKITPAKVEKLMNNPGIIRNRLKIESTISNAKAFIKIQKEFGSFDKYIWSFTEGKTIYNSFKNLKEYPSKTQLSDQISKDLKRRGFRFVGSTIVYAFLQACGIVQDHSTNCYLHGKKLRRLKD
ncbi:DNA-3-methyladenine glycosylase I [Halobacteriovorax sp.]|uniref:DNA-3-methyladenine glycosylase I n=1 Tax=Halobacteriovorax sp. TaxID=2020862 RepID=UPI003AF2DA75